MKRSTANSFSIAYSMVPRDHLRKPSLINKMTDEDTFVGKLTMNLILVGFGCLFGSFLFLALVH
jgi:hypothetical protein